MPRRRKKSEEGTLNEQKEDITEQTNHEVNECGDSPEDVLQENEYRDSEFRAEEVYEKTAEEVQEHKFTIDDLPDEVRSIVTQVPGSDGEYSVLLNKLSEKSISETIIIAKALKIADSTQMKRQELICSILSKLYQKGVTVFAEGTLEVLHDGYGFTRFAHNNYLPSADDVYVSPAQIKKYNLRKGDTIYGTVRAPRQREGERYFALMHVERVNFDVPEKVKDRTMFDNLIPYYPVEKFALDWQENSDPSCRVVDIIAPIGKGQRGLIVSPPRAGKTMLLQNIAKAILVNHSNDTYVTVLLIDERPEEVTDWKKNIARRFNSDGSVNIEVISSTFDESPQRHIQVAEMVLEKAKRFVEHNKHVVILLDSITRLTRAYNQTTPSSGKVLTGGIDSNALQFPKKFFGAARSIENGGSLTILATCLIDTGSRMDEVIFEEFKGTGNMEIYLDRRLSEKRIFPSIDIHRSGTRKEELLHDKDTLQKIWALRKVLQPSSVIDAMELLHEKMTRSKNSQEFFELMHEDSYE